MLALGYDHAGFSLKDEVIKYLDDNGIEYMNFGPSSDEPVDYPVYAKKVLKAILSGECDRGILICGTGIGISIAANRFKGIRAALCGDVFSAKSCRLHNDANVLAFGGRVIGPGLCIEILEAFLNTPFSNEERHMKRIEMIDEI